MCHVFLAESSFIFYFSGKSIQGAREKTKDATVQKSQGHGLSNHTRMLKVIHQ